LCTVHWIRVNMLTVFSLQVYMRMGIKRYRIKTMAAAAVAGHYCLSLKRTTLADIDKLLMDDLYIYPVNEVRIYLLIMSSLTYSC
jgi:hypothetical protein